MMINLDVERSLKSNIMNTHGDAAMTVKPADLKWFEVLEFEFPATIFSRECGGGGNLRFMSCTCAEFI
jgi:hypothetical protein